MKREIYLDNSATTALGHAAKNKIREAMELYGNPSSLHSVGQKAEGLLREARAEILGALGVRPREGELVFTSCGTEATALAFFGTAHAKERRDALRILISDSEHPSVKNSAEALAKEGFEIVKISTKGGLLDIKALEAALDKKILLASFMLVNNETGAVYSVAEAFEKIKRAYPEAVTHCDAVQGFMKLPFTPKSLFADLISISGHKLHAPKGVGALYASADTIRKKKLVPYLYGGGQEKGMRSGTENTMGIAAFGAAVADIKARLPRVREQLSQLYCYTRDSLEALGLRVNTPLGERSDHIINITLPNIKSETMLHFLSAEGIFVSSGSACSSHAKNPSEALLAFGLTPKEADCSLRISLCEYNTKEDIDALCAALAEGLERLVKIK